MDDIFQDILNVLEANGFILLNENPKYPSICGIGGGWQDAVRLINERKAFLTKLIEDKSTYISSKLYYGIKACQERQSLSEVEMLIYEFIQQNEPVGIKFIKACLPVNEKDLNKSLKGLQNKLLVTAVGEEKRLTESWGTYLWGTSDTWERECSKKNKFENPKDIVEMLLSGKISDKKLKILMNAE